MSHRGTKARTRRGQLDSQYIPRHLHLSTVDRRPTPILPARCMMMADSCTGDLLIPSNNEHHIMLVGALREVVFGRRGQEEGRVS